ncbi:MAG: alpha/beta hydrolase [Phyllobacteriaceae bacterium]|jgi:pimeloyl-ACP methyl ester carboxylesterase|nr:alpha/beta hydrolase [Phyllobacteriaceae bacterium]
MKRGSSKAKVLAIPGLHNSWVGWIPQIVALADQADIDVTRAGDAEKTIPAIASAILDVAPPKFSLAGYSMGGYVAFEIMRQAPDRVERLALISTSARGPGPNEAAARDVDRRLVEEGRFEELVAGATGGVRLGLAADPFFSDVRVLTARAAGKQAILNRLNAVQIRIDSRSTLANIQCPTWVLCGADDQICPPHLSQEIASGIEGAQLMVMERCGHFIHYEQAARLSSELAKWLRS